MYACIYIYIYIYISLSLCVYIYIYRHTYIHTHVLEHSMQPLQTVVRFVAGLPGRSAYVEDKLTPGAGRGGEGVLESSGSVFCCENLGSDMQGGS